MSTAHHDDLDVEQRPRWQNSWSIADLAGMRRRSECIICSGALADPKSSSTVSKVKTEPIAIEGVAGPVIVATNAFSGRPVVTVAGQVVPPVGKRQYALPATAGGAVHATLRSRLADPYPTMEANGILHRTGPKVPVVLQVLALLPIVLVGIGGLVGGLIGALGVMANLAIARTRIPSAGKALIMIGIGVVAVLVYLGVAAALRGAINQS